MAGASLAPGQAGAPPYNRKRKAPAPATADGEDEPDEEEDIEELEREIADLNRRILEHRHGAPCLLEAAAFRTTALRPTDRLEVPTVSESSIAEDDQEKLEKLKIIKSNIDANAAALPRVLERMQGCIAWCEKLENLNVNIHPIFKGKR